MDRWRGKLAVVTGASSGIGAAISEALVREGLQGKKKVKKVEESLHQEAVERWKDGDSSNMSNNDDDEDDIFSSVTQFKEKPKSHTSIKSKAQSLVKMWLDMKSKDSFNDAAFLGEQVVGLARRKEKVRELSDRLQGLPGKLHAIKADVTIEDDLLSAIKSATEKFGPVHILINNAGIARPTNLVDGKTEDFRKVLDTNLLAVAVATREAVQNMFLNSVDGHIVNINSTLGHYVSMLPMANVYPASKFGVTAMTETLRKELISLGKNIKVTSISPGYVKTEITKDFLQFDNMRDLEAIAPHLESKDVADCVVFALGTPPHAQVTELTIRPTGELL